MELNITEDETRVEGDVEQSFVGSEADRIAERRVFEDDRGESIEEQTGSGGTHGRNRHEQGLVL